ncbi:hypothetical protein G6F57_011572 [Rhizopus arrhizus]|uniref:Uncharacterized protein n=1 Tax=Rhizopus oryzae TaxID=64495 RepID=A0A9P7BMM8_RHIOR|nr:hypothetical protein G6F23_011427 [Rhizopus arrhizus]KAG0757057.1 hypothetical protein G6F24_010739 [Rhizopus arrhizus]KAG0782243.1 hypothetical protein G6F21_011218 [Rhizopus arrhizus]KAG0788791.1 hypothetical protein G6F22_006900 [Rhizopus arrhizus]KAG0811967.1 hypothetical protein G6F20_006737 [Rhizopus arrhizus]
MVVVKSAKRKYRKTDVESEEDELGEDEVDEEDEEDEGERRNAGRKMDFIVGGEAQVYIEDYLTNMKPDEWKEAKSSLKSLYHNSTPTVKYPEIDGIVETLAEDIDEGEKKAKKWYASTTMNENEESKKIVARILLCLIQKMKTCNLEELKEPLFCSFVVENLVTPFLCLGDGYVKLLGSTDESLGSKERRSDLKGRIPDLSVQVEFNNNSALPFLCEVKSPQSIAGLKKSENQHPDFIKLCNIMKDELDRMCFVTNKVAYGLLVEADWSV